MKERLQKLWSTILERVPHKNYTPEQKEAITKKTAIIGVILGAVIVLLLGVALFPVTDVEIKDNQSKYSDEQIMQALDASGWTPLLALTPHKAEQRLLDELLYLESADVSYRFPGTLQIRVTEQQPLYYFYYETQIGGKDHTGWLAIGPDLRVVDAARAPDTFAERGLTQITLPAPVLDETEPGRASKLRFTREDETGENAKTEQDYAYVSEFLALLEDSSVSARLTKVDLAKKFDVRVTLDGKYRIDFGRVRDAREFEQKFSLAEQILKEAKIEPDQKYIIWVGSDECSIDPTDDLDTPQSEP